jgi:hypothetical protein
MKLAPALKHIPELFDHRLTEQFEDPAKVSKIARAFDDMEAVIDLAIINMISAEQTNAGVLVGAKLLKEKLQLFKVQDEYNKKTT